MNETYGFPPGRDAVVSRSVEEEAEADPTCPARCSRRRSSVPRTMSASWVWPVWTLLMAACLTLGVPGCGGGSNVTMNLRVEELAGAPAVDPEFEYRAEYRIRVGDDMRIEFLSDPEPSTSASEVVVRPDGRISLRGVDDVLAAGLTPAELDSVLTREFTRLLVDPELSVIVETFAREKVYVLGHVVRPQAIQLEGPSSLLQAIASAGGLRQGANRNNIVIVRRLAGGRLGAFKVDAEPIMEGKAGAREVSLHAQDVVIVPTSTVAKVGEFVEQYVVSNLNPVLLSWIFVRDVVQDK